jgi:hypothetical protein
MRSWLRTDLFIAVSALLISSLTCVSTIIQTHVIANQLSATVWPYLSYDSTYDQNSVEVEIINDGLGPALVRSALLTVDGRPMATWEDAGKALGKSHGATRLHGSFSSLGPGSVIRAGAAHQLVHLTITGGRLADQVVAIARLRNWMQARVIVTICYCSTLDNCWLTRSGPGSPEPSEIGHCPGASEIGV